MTLERIEITPVAVIAGEILQNRRTGYLTVLAPARQVLYWSQGELVMAASPAATASLADLMVRRGVISADRAADIFATDTNDVVARVHESGVLDLSARQTLLREWLAAQFIPLFSLDEGTAAFTEDEPLPPEQRVFVQSTAALLIEGVRSISNGLVLRRSLGDLKREIQFARDARFGPDSLPLSEQERSIATSLNEPEPIEAFLKRFSSQSTTAAKVTAAMLVLGVYEAVQERAVAPAPDLGEMQRDLELLAAIGSNDPRSLRAAALSKHLSALDHYQLLNVPRAATRSQIISAAEDQRKIYDPSTFPPAVRDAIAKINERIDEAVAVLTDPVRRSTYEKLTQSRSPEGTAPIHQRLTQRSIAEQNYTRAKELTSRGDYYGAIVLLKQCVTFVPDHVEAWQLLGSCQERNPRWRRDAAESFQMALSIDPTNVETMISLGDLYKTEGMIGRAQTCYEDVLKISPDSQQAKSRLQALKKR